MKTLHAALIAAALAVCIISSAAIAADWPEYRFDAARANVSPEKLAPALYTQWTYVSRHAPRPAWPEPGRELHRMPFDYAYHAVVAGGIAYFGSSADHKVYALNVADGQEVWSFFTGGPVRLAPSVAGDKVLAASDDGNLYCLGAKDGKLLWSFRGGPRQDWMMGNEQMVSRWPLRTGVAVQDDIAYFSAGMWPSEGVYLYALNVADGSVVWRNDTSGQMYLEQPHPPSMAMTGVAPQGPIVVYDDQIFVPTGRNVPAAFNRITGEFMYYDSRPDNWGCRWGGSWSFAAGDLLFNWRSRPGADLDVSVDESDPYAADGIVAWNRQTSKIRWEMVGRTQAALKDNILYAAGTGKLSAYDFTKLLQGKKPEECVKWEVEHGRAYALVMAGDTIILGGREIVTGFSAGTGKQLWQAKVDGQARGIAVAGGKVLVSTSTGQIVCLGPNELATPGLCKPTGAEPQSNPDATAMAKEIIDLSGVASGYCVVLGSGDGTLAAELARQSNLSIWCIEPDGDLVSASRRMLDAEGLYGLRVTVHQGDLTNTAYPKYFADLIVAGPSVAKGLTNCSAAETYRILRPCGGIACFITSGPNLIAPAGRVKTWLARGGVPNDEIKLTARTAQVVRGKLPGAGEFTHQYGSVARTGASNDEFARLPVEALWFGEPGPATLVSRHWRGPAPLAINGRLFVIGQNVMTAVDAYNGRQLWQADIGTQKRFPVDRTGGRSVADDASVYTAVGSTCTRLDAATGKVMIKYELPKPGADVAEADIPKLNWDYLGVTGGIVLGTEAIDTQGLRLFAMNKSDGALRWTYKADQAIDHNAVAASDGVVYVIDRPTAAQVDKLKRRGEKLSEKSLLVALDAGTGRMLWKTDRGLSTRIDLIAAGDAVLATGGGRTSVYSAKTGRMLSWSGMRMRGFPIVVGDTIYGEPFAYDLHTGERRMREHPFTGAKVAWDFRRSYGCGVSVGAPNVLMFRSGATGMYDLANDSGTHNFGGVRAGCYVNMIAANGLLLVPPQDAACTCSYNFQSTVALTPTDRNEQWSVFWAPAPPKGARIKHVSLNFGATGDKRDAAGDLWLAFPRPAGIAVPLTAELSASSGYYRQNSDELDISGTTRPWLYASGIRGEAKLSLALGSEETKSYAVVLHFAEMDDVRAGGRVFDVKIQGETAIKDLDVVREAGGRYISLTRKITGVTAASQLAIELIPHVGTDSAPKPPILSAIEIREE